MAKRPAKKPAPAKRVYPSGAQKRKARREREAAAPSGEEPQGSWAARDPGTYMAAVFNDKAPPQELPIYGQAPSVYVRQVQATLLQLEQGQFYAPAILWDGWLREPWLYSKLNDRLSGLLGEKMELEPADPDKEQDVACKDDAEIKLDELLPPPQLEHLHRYALGLSVGIAQRLKTTTSKSWTPTLKVWNPRHLRFDWGSRQYMLITENRGEIPIVKGDPEWVIWEPFGPQAWLSGALIRPLATPCTFISWVRNWWGRRQEVHGQPIRAGIIPTKRTPADERRFLTQLANLAHEATIRLPQGEEGNRFDVKLIEAQSTDWEGFKELYNTAKQEIMVVCVGQTSSTSGTPGLGAQEKAGEPTMLRLLRKDARLGTCLREQHLKPWAAEQHGDAERAPRVTWDIEPPEDLDKKASAMLKGAQAVETLARAPSFAKHVEERELLEDMGFPLRAEEEIEVDEVDPTTPADPALPVDPAVPVDPAETAPAGAGGETAATAVTLALTPSALESIVRVDEGRAAAGLPPVKGEEGQRYVLKHAAMLKAELAKEGTPTSEPGAFGAPAPKVKPEDDKEETEDKPAPSPSEDA